MFREKINNIYIICLIIFGISLITSCSDDDSESRDGISLSLDNTTISASATSQFIEVKATGAWKLSISFPPGTGQWCMIDNAKTQGVGNANVVLKYYANLDAEERRATIVLESGSEVVMKDIVQKGKTPTDPNPDPEPTPSAAWLELPALVTKDGCKFITHYTNIGTNRARNYSMFYDTKEKLAYWVAYPLHKSYIGDSGRTDAWAFDPALSQTEQPNLFSGFGSGFDRGHQIPSGDRTSDKVTNRQTFYFTNMTAQNSTLNQGVWANLETQCRSWMANYDTLYVTTGAILKTVSGNENWSKLKESAVPNYYFKVLLGKKGTTYKSVGFWFKNESYPSNKDFKTYAKTVREIESLTGFDFFSNLPKNIQDEVEAAYKAQDWNL